VQNLFESVKISCGYYQIELAAFLQTMPFC